MTIEEEIKLLESRCVCTEEYYCNPCRKVEKLKQLMMEHAVDCNCDECLDRVITLRGNRLNKKV